MKILVITDLYPIKDDEKHTPKTIYDFVQEWKKQGHEVKIIKPNFMLNSFLRKKPFYKSGIYGDVENINYWLPFWGGVKNKVKSVQFGHLTPALSSRRGGEDFHIVIAHMPSGLIFANKLGLDFCAGVHVSDIEVLTNPIYSIYFKPELEKAYQNAKKIACRSFVLKEKFLKLYPEFAPKTFVAPSGIDFEPIKREWKPNGKIKVLTCGQFIKRKNIDKVIQACDDFENIELTVIGSGGKYRDLRKLSEKPVFTGQLTHEKVLEKMRESDIFILPSVNETFGMVYLEAMASGCITVCTKNDGIDGIIKDNENGFLTEARINELKGIIQRILDYPDKNKILFNAYKTVLLYNAKTVADDYIKNINSGIKG